MSRRIDPAELDDLKSRTLLSAVFEKYGVKSRGSKKARWAVCCFHAEKSGSLKIDDERGRYHCFGCGAAGDHFSVLTELGGKTFMEAVEVLGGVRLITVEERQAIEVRNKEWEDEERKQLERTRKSIAHTFTTGKPIAGTHVAAYLEQTRGLRVGKSWTFDLRFIPDLVYRGFATADAEESVDLGAFPAMVAAIRAPGGEIVGLHRTYLDRDAPKKLTPPGDQRRNKAKKVLGEQRGGYIRLSPDASRLAVGEGIETSRAWLELGYGGDDIAVGAAVSLGNLSGGSMGSMEHPDDPAKRIPNGIPDMDRPGMVLSTCVRELILLGDGDSDPAMTRARLLVGGRRFRNLGISVSFAMAPAGLDFADLLLEDVGANP